MIDRKEALKLASYEETPNYHQRLIAKIYDSIGSCGECKYYSSSGTCIIQYGDKGLCLDKTEHDFCSDFERKET